MNNENYNIIKNSINGSIMLYDLVANTGLPQTTIIGVINNNSDLIYYPSNVIESI